MKPIQSYFRKAQAAVCAIYQFGNEWRDTLSYATLAALVANDFAGGGGLSIPLEMAPNIVAVREMLRSVSWKINREECIAGELTKPVDNHANSCAAIIIGHL